ncbi:hypothetical protein OE88DRAFT_14028 [Heliocybe sulcata]|uniref:Uncharacterized protein n=1 Tax=Heliocybe sulcata TaxID=5364 RepID=A0A5C3NRS7_9AGAM|nr:hypothetical protein OE88DRAFT_14028 [Heliocybe sulcata]
MPAYMPPRPPTGESHYPPSIGLPTSATRGSWPGAPAWAPEGGPPQMGQFQSYYHPSPYYRASAGATQPQQPAINADQNQPPAGLPPAQGTPEGAPGSEEASAAIPAAAVVDPQLAGGDVEMKDGDGDTQVGDVKSPTPPSVSVIDPALEASSGTAPSAPVQEDEQPKPVSMQMTAAAMQAVIDAITPKVDTQPAVSTTEESAPGEEHVAAPPASAENVPPTGG